MQASFIKNTVILTLSLPVVVTLMLAAPQTLRAEGIDGKGWNYLISRLQEYGISHAQIESVFNDKRMPAFSKIPFKLNPKESHRSYAQFKTKSFLQLAKTMLDEQRTYFDASEDSFDVERQVVAAILLIETQFGNYTGRQPVFYRLARVASVQDPHNLAYNFKRVKKTDPNATWNELFSRAEYLEETFLPEVVALFDLAEIQEIDIHSLKGSTAGAFGISQFLPRSFIRFSVDGNDDGSISLFDLPDAIASTANFLAYHGWRKGLSDSEKRDVIWHYNRSAAYTLSVLEVSKLLSEN